MANKLLKTLNFGTEDTYHLAPSWENIQDKPSVDSGGGSSLYPLPLVAEITLEEDVSSVEFKVEQFPLMAGLKSALYIEGEIIPSEATKTANKTWYISVSSESASRYCFTSNKALHATETSYYECTIERITENRTNAMTVTKGVKYGMPQTNTTGNLFGGVMFDNWHGQRTEPINMEHLVLIAMSGTFGVGTTFRVYGR